MSETKRSYSGIIFIIIAIIAVFVIFKPFGGDKIEGEWIFYSTEMDGEIRYFRDEFDGKDVTITFYDDGTAQVYRPAVRLGYSSSETCQYSYSNGRLVLDGDEVDCKISGKTMTWIYDYGGKEMVMTLKRS